MSETRRQVVMDPVHGYRRLDPVPTPAEHDDFYRHRYYELLRAGGRAPHLRRLTGAGPEAEGERSWLRETLYADIAHALRQHGAGTRVLDVGCGTGELVSVLGAEGFDAAGVEPSPEAAEAARERGLETFTGDLAAYAASRPDDAFDAIVAVNVFEHVPDPVSLLGQLRDMLRDGGLACIQVPNDFNALQIAAQSKLGKPPWWIAIPDHVNYFDFDSLSGLLDACGFQVLERQTDFPMELFLLMGLDYVDDPEVGNRCHGYRVADGSRTRAAPSPVRCPRRGRHRAQLPHPRQEDPSPGSVTLEPIVSVIQARMSSSRLPGKVLRPLAGVSVLEHVVSRAREFSVQVAICTSLDPSDAPIAELCESLGVICVRGPLDDVFSRYRRALADERLEPTA
jgi:SAM-dependent methyltransferase